MIKIITTCYNCEKFIEKCILSALMQDYDNWEMYIFDDASTDNSVEVAEKTINGDNRIKIIKNPKNMGAVYNKTFNFVKVCDPEDEDIIVTLDGDDFFNKKEALTYLNNVYLNGWWMTYGGASHTNTLIFPEDFHTEIDWLRSLRNQRFCLGHLRSHKFFLMKNIKDIDLRYRNGTLFKIPEDVILFIPMAEMCGKRKAHYLKQSLYFYRCHPNCDASDAKKNSHRTDIIIKDLSVRQEYAVKTKEELLNWKCDWTFN